MAGRVMQDVERKMSNAAFQAHKATMIKSELILTQKRATKGKNYSLHAPEVECFRNRGVGPAKVDAGGGQVLQIDRSRSLSGHLN